MLENLLPMLATIAGIVVIDLVLSGDNAVVIGMAARRLPPKQRRLAILLGGACAIGLRALFAAIAALLLRVPLLQAAGGVLLLWIGWKLLHDAHRPHVIGETYSLAGALKVIILADVVMSLDNILAIAGISHGDVFLLLFGLAVSMPLVLAGSAIIASLMARMPWLVYVGAAVLAWTAGQMVVEDPVVAAWLPEDPATALLVPALLTTLLFAATMLSRVAQRPAEVYPREPQRTPLFNRGFLTIMTALALLWALVGARVCVQAAEAVPIEVFPEELEDLEREPDPYRRRR